MFDVVQNLPLVYDVENTGAGFASVVPTFAQSPSNFILPDPFRSFDGYVDLSFDNWERRRAEVKASIETYEIGRKPDASEVDVTVAFIDKTAPLADTLYVYVTRRSNGVSLRLRAAVLLPAGSGPFPAIIGMNSSSGSIPSDIFTSRDIARVYYRANDVTVYSFFGEGVHTNDPFYLMYPEYNTPGNHGQYAAWSWGVSRLIDGIQMAAQQGLLPIDVAHLGVTGCSYAGKMALFAGALDERVALTIAQESGGGGMPAWRPSWVLRDPRGDVERFGNTNGAWFIRGMKSQFGDDNVFRLPHDHHQLMALVAPRALLATNNYDYIWLSNPSAYISARATQETYEQLGIEDRFGFIVDGSLTGSSHGHCAVPASQRPIIEAFVDRFMKGQSVTTSAQVTPYPEMDYAGWMPWALRSDIATLVTQGVLSADQGAGLRDKLEAALSSIASGRTNPALNQLDAFNNQLDALVNSGALTADQAAALAAKINSTKVRLGA
jgi:hypothetical protein